MRAGLLSERITIQYKAVSRAANGEEIVTWTTLFSTWAEVSQIRGREFFAAAQMQDSVDTKVTIRYRVGVATDQRIMWRDIPMNIVAVIMIGREEGLELMCLSGVRSG